MQSVAKFVTKAYPVSGCLDYLSEVRTKKSISPAPFLLSSLPPCVSGCVSVS